MSNSFNISVAPEIAALDTKIDTIDTEVGVIDGIVDSIKLKTDATPQNVRGRSYFAGFSTGSAAFLDVCNVTGHGVLLQICVANQLVAVTLEVRVTIDGVAAPIFSTAVFPANVWMIPNALIASTTFLEWREMAVTVDPINFSNIEYDTSLRVELRKSAGPASAVFCTCYYILDGF